MNWLSFGISSLTSLALIPVIRRISNRYGFVSTPRRDRWHRKPTPNIGGVAIYLAFILSILAALIFNDETSWEKWGLLIGSSMMFFMGLYDDFKQLSPQTKLLGQILAASIVILLGYTTDFFSPKISNNIVAQIPNVILTFIWLIGITNAINLLDNMDGLAGGITLVSAIILSYFFWQAGDTTMLWISMALAGSILGFLVYNFPPASIFMGDSGSMFLGFTMAVLAIARQPQASNIFAILGVPTLIFILPILDTILVTSTRILRGESPVQGGRDHTSHRLVAFGLTERQTVLTLIIVALISGSLAIILESLDYWFSLILVPVVVLSLALLTAYLARLKIVSAAPSSGENVITRLMVEMTVKRRSLEIILDFTLIGISYYLAFWLYSGLSMTEEHLLFLLRSIPIVYGGTYISFFLFGIYRGVWQYVGIDDLIRYLKAVLGSVIIVTVITYFLFNYPDFPFAVFILNAIFLFLGLAASRSSFKILDQIFVYRTIRKEEKVLIIGADNPAEMAARWILMNPDIGYYPVGFLDTNSYTTGRRIHGIEILGEIADLEKILDQHDIDGVILAINHPDIVGSFEKIKFTCNENDCWVRTLRLEFDPVE
jgi:UDP-GlcNAc:undecaprenyl-phosphate GlcNAc-1-phosphate transferase